jgi:hypothetical protein
LRDQLAAETAARLEAQVNLVLSESLVTTHCAPLRSLHQDMGSIADPKFCLPTGEKGSLEVMLTASPPSTALIKKNSCYCERRVKPYSSVF